MYYKSDTLVIREFVASECSMFLELFESPNVTKYLSYQTPEQYRGMFGKALTDYKNSPFSRWGVFNTKGTECVGMCMVRIFVENTNQLEIGYSISEKYWGKGIGTEICRALVHYCLSLSKDKDIVAVTDLDNIGSQKVLTKVGFERKEDIKREQEVLAYFIFQK